MSEKLLEKSKDFLEYLKLRKNKDFSSSRNLKWIPIKKIQRCAWRKLFIKKLSRLSRIMWESHSSNFSRNSRMNLRRLSSKVFCRHFLGWSLKQFQDESLENSWVIPEVISLVFNESIEELLEILGKICE